MFPNNPLFVEKLVHAKQEDIMREVQNMPPSFPFIRSRLKNKVVRIVVLLVTLAWLFSVIL